MIIEGAFYNLPEILLGSHDHNGIYEANVANIFAMGVLLELNSRNIDNPLQRIQLERRYNSPYNTRADLFLSFSGLFSNHIGLEQYGLKDNNWIEAKYFGGIGRNTGNETTTENAGSLAFDIFRLCALTSVSHLNAHKTARYVINIFNRHPIEYLAFNRAVGGRRHWLEGLVNPGQHEMRFDLMDEPSTIRKVFGKAFATHAVPLSLDATVITREFSPFVESEHSQFWGYLSRIVEFDLVLDGIEVRYSDANHEEFTEEDAQSLSTISQLASRLIRSNEY